MPIINTEIPVLPGRVGKKESLFLNRLWNCIELKGREPGFGVQHLADYMEVSRAQLTRKLIYLTGYTPGKLLIYYRLQTAMQLLNESDDPVKQIAWQSGFQAHGSFSRSFNNEFNCSPSHFRSPNKPEPENTFRWKLPLGEDDFMQLHQMADQKPWLTEFLRMVIANLGNETFKVTQAASALYISPSSLIRKIKETFQITPQRFIRDMRLQYAGELLAERFGSVSEIAYKAGFFDHAHLCRCFKEAFGCSPTAFSKKIGKEISISWLENKLMKQNVK